MYQLKAGKNIHVASVVHKLFFYDLNKFWYKKLVFKKFYWKVGFLIALIILTIIFYVVFTISISF